jgi:FkbM family methyltransferase
MSIPERPRVAFVLAGTDHGTMIVNRLDWYEKEDGGAIGVGLALLNNGSYAATETRFLAELLTGLRETRGDGVVALDIGANIGTFTIAWAQHMEGWGIVIAIEPQERVFYALAGNIALNNCFNARAILGAAAATSGSHAVPRLDFQKPANSGGLSLTAGPHNKPGQHIDWHRVDFVSMVRVDDMPLHRIDLIKIDVEGMEPEVLMGAQHTRARDKPVIFAEHTICGVDRIKGCLPGYRFLEAGMDTLAMPEGDPLWDRIKVG